MFNDANTSRNDLLHFENLGTKVSERCSNDETYIKWRLYTQSSKDNWHAVNSQRLEAHSAYWQRQVSLGFWKFQFHDDKHGLSSTSCACPPKSAQRPLDTHSSRPSPSPGRDCGSQPTATAGWPSFSVTHCGEKQWTGHKASHNRSSCIVIFQLQLFSKNFAYIKQNVNHHSDSIRDLIAIITVRHG